MQAVRELAGELKQRCRRRQRVTAALQLAAAQHRGVAAAAGCAWEGLPWGMWRTRLSGGGRPRKDVERRRRYVSPQHTEQADPVSSSTGVRDASGSVQSGRAGEAGGCGGRHCWLVHAVHVVQAGCCIYPRDLESALIRGRYAQRNCHACWGIRGQRRRRRHTTRRAAPASGTPPPRCPRAAPARPTFHNVQAGPEVPAKPRGGMLWSPSTVSPSTACTLPYFNPPAAAKHHSPPPCPPPRSFWHPRTPPLPSTTATGPPQPPQVPHTTMMSLAAAAARLSSPATSAATERPKGE